MQCDMAYTLFWIWEDNALIFNIGRAKRRHCQYTSAQRGMYALIALLFLQHTDHRNKGSLHTAQERC